MGQGTTPSVTFFCGVRGSLQLRAHCQALFFRSNTRATNTPTPGEDEVANDDFPVVGGISTKRFLRYIDFSALPDC